MSFTGQWKRYACCPLDQIDDPSPKANLTILVIAGYVYRTLPQLFDQTGQRVLALQSSVDFNQLQYRWKLYHKIGQGKVYHLSTSDDIVPVVYDDITKQRLSIERKARHNGYTSWEILV